MWAFIALTAVLFVGLLNFFAMANKQEVLDHWDQYNKNVFFLFFLAPFYKPDSDPRSRLQFAFDNFNNLLSTFADDTMKTIMQPVMQIFKLLTDAIGQTVEGLFNVRGLLKSMWSQFNSMTEVFINRFQGTLTALRATYMKLHSAIGKMFGVAVAGIMSGLSAYQATLSVFDLVINIIITILIIIAAIFIWLPFLFIAVLALIIIVVQMIERAGQGDKISGIAGVFCFQEGTLVKTEQGEAPIESIALGATLADEGHVQAVLKFDQETDDMYELYGVKVSGSHIVYTDAGPTLVERHPLAVKLPKEHRKVYCFITTSRRIPIVSSSGVIEFADWEEIESDIDYLKKWNEQVFTILNPNQIYIKPSPYSLTSEAGFTGGTHVMTPIGPMKIQEITPGCKVIDADGKQTTVRGIIELAAEEVINCIKLSNTSYMSSGNWTKVGNTWLQQHTLCGTKPATETWFQLFTESGTFSVIEGGQFIEVRDFTDVGVEIEKTYDWVLKTLAEKI